MKSFVDIPPELAPVWEQVAQDLVLVGERFDAHLESELPAMDDLVRHVERYRGKMLRPMLCLIAGRAAAGAPISESQHADLVTSSAVVEMVHMATLVHDDVLDEASIRRGGTTINALRGNEAAVILGDYLIAGAFLLCSLMSDQERAVLIGRVSMEMCSGELLQLSRREDFSLDDSTYFKIVDGKTAALVGAACRLGGMCVQAEPSVCNTLDSFGRRVGIAFQIQDDLIDLTKPTQTSGKSTGRDLSTGKTTLPLIHHLASASPAERGRTLREVERAAEPGSKDRREALREHLAATGSMEFASQTAERLIREAKRDLQQLPESPSRTVLGMLADAAVARDA